MLAEQLGSLGKKAVHQVAAEPKAEVANNKIVYLQLYLRPSFGQRCKGRY